MFLPINPVTKRRSGSPRRLQTSEHLLDVFTSVDSTLVYVWDACCDFMEHPAQYESRLVMLGPKVERLPDDHPSQPRCLFALSSLFDSVGNRGEYKRLLAHAVKIWKERGDDPQVARILIFSAESNGQLDFWKEGTSRREALEIYERLSDTSGQAHSLQLLAWSLHGDNQLDAAEEAASRAVDLLRASGEQFRVCQCHCILGKIYSSKGDTAKAITHFQTALGIASSFH